MSELDILPPDRLEGFYWVGYAGHWEVAFWTDGEWYLTGNELPISDAELTEIGERLDPPTVAPKAR